MEDGDEEEEAGATQGGIEATDTLLALADRLGGSMSRSESETSCVSVASTSSDDLPNVSGSSTSSRVQDVHTVTPEPSENIFDSEHE
ncbi:hypothetical protein E2C01_046853 [Portunus trituberculatus]|uniref:Uncharacterized protein n=1 Tax=Portunus trituberculatus TaxID=210409 RepID=A0A5B7FZM7_PORTR|nr:hypothetical protein [Portunus trituberculatus]